MKFGRKKQGSKQPAVQTVARDAKGGSLLSQYEAQGRAERELYSSLREAVPIVDAAICKTVRLIGNFKVEAESKAAQKIADEFIKNVKTNGNEGGMINFVYSYLDSLLTYGAAVGEMIPTLDADGISALYNASLDDVEIRADKTPLDLTVCRNDMGQITPVKYQNLVLATLLNPKAGAVCGTSILSGLPFVSSILLRIFQSLKNNWERVGDVRFAVTYTPNANEAFSEESARQIAAEWKKAMRSSTVCDFVAAGDVSVKVIGAENQMPDCEIPVRTITEQIIAKLGIPPFLLGLSWSSTERMSQQQADILTSELEYYRAVVEPVIRRVIESHLRLSGYTDRVRVIWNDINLQDSLELSEARLNNARALQIEKEIGLEVIDE